MSLKTKNLYFCNFQILKKPSIIQTPGFLLRNFLFSIGMYLINLLEMFGYKRFNANKRVLFKRMLHFMYNVPQIKNIYLEYYVDRKNYSICMVYLWEYYKYIHILDQDDQILFTNYLEFLIDFWNLIDSIKNFRIYINSTITVFDDSIQALCSSYQLFTKNNLRRFLYIPSSNNNILRVCYKDS